MDPNATLAEIRAFIAQANETGDSEESLALGNHIIDRFEALDKWITSGGFLPDAWQPKSAPREQTWACCTSSIGPVCQHKREE